MKIRFAVWLFDNVTLPSWALPLVMGVILGRKPHKVEDHTQRSHKIEL